MSEVTKLDVLARLFGLMDFQTNPGNYGFVLEPDGRMKAKAIDFRLQEKNVELFAHSDGDFQAFLNGNGQFNYATTGAPMYYALYKRQKHLRVQEAQSIMSDELQQFELVVDGVCQQVRKALAQITMTSDDQAVCKKVLFNIWRS